MPRSLERPQVTVRLDSKTYYLLELAGRINDQSTSDVIRNALKVYYTTISPYPIETFLEPFRGTKAPTLTELQAQRVAAEEELAKESLDKLGDLLWLEDESSRLRILASCFPHLVTDTEWHALKEEAK